MVAAGDLCQSLSLNLSLSLSSGSLQLELPSGALLCTRVWHVWRVWRVMSGVSGHHTAVPSSSALQGCWASEQHHYNDCAALAQHQPGRLGALATA